LVVNQYFVQFERDGAGGNFTDALYPLSDSLDSFTGQTIRVLDWGMFDNVNFLHWGKLDLQPEADNVPPNQNSIFLTHVPAREEEQGVGKRFDAAAKAASYQKQVIRIIPDSNGRPVFDCSGSRVNEITS
jgi:hypothetical protein